MNLLLLLVLAAAEVDSPSNRSQAADDCRVPSLSGVLSADLHRILGDIKQTKYSHKTRVDKAQGRYEMDCSGLACYLLKRRLPEHYGAVAKPERRARPLAEDFFKCFSSAPTTDTRTGVWRQVPRVLDAVPGDLLAWASRNPKTGSTGHVVFIDQVAREAKNGQVRVVVIDSTSSPHGEDSRARGETGIGRGVMWLAIDEEGRPTGYRWSSPTGKLQRRSIAIGRPVGKEPLGAGR